ncbi:unnamed protein product [Gadus morhua 'NCC']
MLSGSFPSALFPLSQPMVWCPISGCVSGGGGPWGPEVLVQDGGCLEEKTCLNQGVGGVMLGNGAGGRRMWACLGVMRTWHPEVPRTETSLCNTRSGVPISDACQEGALLIVASDGDAGEKTVLNQVGGVIWMRVGGMGMLGSYRTCIPMPRLKCAIDVDDETSTLAFLYTSPAVSDHNSFLCRAGSGGAITGLWCRPAAPRWARGYREVVDVQNSHALCIPVA